MKNVFLLTLLILFFSLFSPLIKSPLVFAQEESVSQSVSSGIIDDAGRAVGEAVKKSLLDNIKKIFKDEVLPVWQKMWNWFRDNIWSRIENFMKDTNPLIKEEIEKRKPVVQEEFQKEKEEMKQEAPKVGKSLWEKFKELIK